MSKFDTYAFIDCYVLGLVPCVLTVTTLCVSVCMVFKLC